MSAEGEGSSNRRGEPRVPFDGAVRLRYRLFQEFLEENAANISAGGMFIRTIHPGELGSELEFAIRLDDDFTLIEGRAEVVWVRRERSKRGEEPGMGIRFVELAGQSRALVDKIVTERVAAGLELFDLEGEAPASGERPDGHRAVAAPVAGDDGPIWELDGSDAKSAEPPPAGPAEAPSQAPPMESLAALDPELPPAAAPPAPDQAAGRRRGAGATSRSRPTRLIAVAVLSALVGAGAVLTFYWLYVQPSIDALETRIEELAGSPGGPWSPPAAEPEPDAVADDAAAEGEVAAGDEPTGDLESTPAAVSDAGRNAEVVDALRGWAAAWSEKRVEDYLGYYAAAFVPPDGLDRSSWEAARRARIERPRWIRVALTLVQVELTGPDSAEARFVQSYRSERYKDLVRKRLSMVREEGGWKIAAERSSP